ncbi:hypothetical protein G7046_g2903 [Stylonectria norvegica]|nr:hypothetical protein G7046_g2903 [Stylonectria norvegica]
MESAEGHQDEVARPSLTDEIIVSPMSPVAMPPSGMTEMASSPPPYTPMQQDPRRLGEASNSSDEASVLHHRLGLDRSYSPLVDRDCFPEVVMMKNPLDAVRDARGTPSLTRSSVDTDVNSTENSLYQRHKQASPESTDMLQNESTSIEAVGERAIATPLDLLGD